MKFVLFILLVAVHLQNDLSSGKPVKGVVQIPEELISKTETSRPRITDRSLSGSGDSFGRFSHFIDEPSLSRSRDQVANDFGKSLQLRRWQNGNESFRSRNDEDDLRSTIPQSYEYFDDQPKPRITGDSLSNFRRSFRRSSQSDDDEYLRTPSGRPSRETEDEPFPRRMKDDDEYGSRVPFRQPLRNFDQLTRIRSRMADEGIDFDKLKRPKFVHKELSSEKQALFEKLKKDANGGIIIEGKKGEIKVDSKIVRSDDEEFANEGEIRLRIEDGRIYINHKVVFDNKSSSSSRLNNSAKVLKRFGMVSSFVMVVEKDGKIQFIDNNGNKNFDTYVMKVVPT